MAINERLIHTAAAAAAGAGSGNQEEGLILHLDASDVDSFDGDGSVWYDITNHEYKPATNVSEHFNTVLYDTTGSTASITGVGFEPELVWIKRTDGGGSNYLFDQVRGVHKALISEQTYAEIDKTSYLTSFDSDGFSLGTNSALIGAGNSYVAWCFKAGGTAIANTDGSIASSVSINTDLGFSITKYNGNATSGATVGHGLGVKPELIIVKNLDAAVSWGVWTTGIGLTEVLRLNQDTAATTPATAYFTPQNNTGSVFGLGTNDETNDGSDDYIAYCFASKRGVSKVGSYTGTGAAGNKVYTGFEPAWLMVKESSSTGNWRIMDNVRDTGNVKDLGLWANLSNAQSASSSNTVSFNRDGFTLQGSGSDVNATNQTYIYLAFAKDTNETELIDDTDLSLHFDAADLTSAANTTWTDKANSVALTKSGTVNYDDELGDFVDFGSGYYGNDTATNTIKDSNADYSVEFWYNWDNVSGNNVILGVMQDASNRGALLYFSGSTMDFYNYKDGTMGGSQYTTSTWSTLGITTGKWYHICYVIDSSTDIKTYVDGELKVTSTSNAGGTHWTSMDGIRIGDMETLSYAIDGKLGQMRIYKGQLSQDQIRQNFNFTKNDYPNETHGTLSSTSWNSNNYFEFNGSTSTVDLGVDGLGRSQDISISVWFKPESGNVNDGTFLVYQPGVNSHSTPHYSHTIQVESAGHREFIQYSSNSGSVSTTNFNSGVGSLDLGSWQHFVLTREDGELKWYKNGNTTPIATGDLGDITTSFGATTLVSRIGGRIAGSSSNTFEGDISKVKVYDRAISSDEVAELFAEGKGH